MALGDLMASRFSHSAAAVVVSNHSDDYGSRENGEFVRRDPEASSSTGVIYGNATLASSPSSTMVTVTATTEATSMAYLPQNVVLCELRHEAFETCVPAGPAEGGLVSRWRPRQRMKTGMVALVLCLNITVDPPDVIKISPCARMECWIDPLSMAPQKAVDMIGKALSLQYERWQPKARYKHQLDPSVEDVKKLCITCRRLAKSERVLFHYNGHGVPKPTSNGEIWVFNKSYTQYIPLPISELDSWLKTPSIYVFDCSAAGLLVNAFMELQDAASSSVSPRDCILLAACEAHETLPQSAEFPADIFTSCLTTPIQMALRWFCKRSLLCESLDYSLIDKIPGHPNDRKTLLGELNWIFTAVTDTIAWNVLPRELFQKLFRQDLLVVSLFRNFLLAERIMRSANCSPISLPMLPPTHQHHMWDAWDMAAEICLSQLPLLVDDPGAEFQPSPFFKEQLTAFEVWLDHGSMQKKPPEQLPIVLQVLHSQCHRFQALVLLGRFLDMGPWAVDLALSVGIFPYVLKLLQKTIPELQQILVFIWTQILALDKSCQVDLVKGGGHLYFIRFLDSLEVYPDHQHAMAAFVLAVIVDGHRRGQEACIEAGLLHVCLRHLQASTPDDAHTEPLFLQWLCLCLGKLWEDFTDAQMLGLQADAPSICAALLAEPQPEVRASAVFALGTLLDVGFDSSSDGVGGDEECDDNEKLRAEISIIKSLLEVFYDGSPLVRAEVAVALARFAFGHNRHLKSITRTHWRHHPGSGLGSLHLAHVRSTGTDCSPSHYIPSGSIIGPVLRVGGDSASVVRDGRVSTSSPLAISGMMHGSPLSDDSSLHSDSGTSIDAASTGVMNHARHRLLDSGLYTHCILTMCALAKDPSPRIVNIGHRVLSIIGIEQVVARPVRSSGGIGRPVDPSTSASPSLAGLARSSSWFEMSKGQLPLTPPVSPPRTNYLTGMRRVYSLELRPYLLNSTHTGLADPLVAGVPSNPERSFLPQSSIYKWSCGHFSKPLLTAPDDNEELLARREEKEKATLDLIAKCQHYSVSKLNNQIVNWDTKFESGTKTALLQPFSPIVVAADDHEQIRVWNYKEETLLNSFENHNFPDKEISKLCLVNELDDSLLLVASGDGNIRIWKDYCQRGRQKLVTAFSSIRSLRPGVYNANAVVDWQQQSGYLYASEEASPIMLWDLGKEQLTNSIPSRSESDISALAASPVHGGNFAAGFVDGSVRIFDIRTPEMLVCATRPHIHRVERVVGIGFQPGLDPAKIVSASQAGDIQFLDVRNYKEAYLTIDEHGGLLTAFSVHRYAPIIVSGLANQLIKVFSLEGSLLGTIRHYPTFMAQRIRSVRCLAFHPFQVLLAVGAADAFVSIYADENTPAR